MVKIPKAIPIFLGFWLAGAIIASLDKDIFLGLTFALLGVVVFRGGQ